MALYSVTRPSDESPYPVFTTYGRLTQSFRTACNRAQKCSGKVYEIDGHNTKLMANYWVAPVPAPTTPTPKYRDRFRPAFVASQLFY